MITMNVSNNGLYTIKTKYRYQVIEKKTFFDGEPYDYDKTQDFVRYQPDVFDKGGIPLILIEKKTMDKPHINNWSIGFSMATCGILPSFESSHSHSQWNISLSGDDSVSATVESCERIGNSTAFIPTPWLIFWGTSTCYSDCRIFDKHAFTFNSTYIDQPLEDEALAYGIATRLKELEETGRIKEQEITKSISVYNFLKETEKQTAIRKSILEKEGLTVKGNDGRQKYKFEIIQLECEDGKDFAYRFELAATANARVLLTDVNLIRTVFRSSLKEHYSLGHTDINPRSLIVDFPEFSVDNGHIVGRAVVLTISVESIVYDSSTRKGRLSIRINVNQFEEARQWIRNNICDLATEAKERNNKGESLVGDRFYIGNETLKENGILEIEFKTE